MSNLNNPESAFCSTYPSQELRLATLFFIHYFAEFLCLSLYLKEIWSLRSFRFQASNPRRQGTYGSPLRRQRSVEGLTTLAEQFGLWAILHSPRFLRIPKWYPWYRMSQKTAWWMKCEQMSEVYQFVRLWDVQHIRLTASCSSHFFKKKILSTYIYIYIYIDLYIHTVYTYTLQ